MITIFGAAPAAPTRRPDGVRPRLAVVRPEHIAGHRDGIDAPGAAFLDEVAGHERALQLREEFIGLRRHGTELAIEAAVLRALSDEGAQHREMSDVSLHSGAKRTECSRRVSALTLHGYREVCLALSRRHLR